VTGAAPGTAVWQYSRPRHLPAHRYLQIWLPVVSISALQIDEVYFQGSDAEFIALVNQEQNPYALAGWMVGDAETPSSQEGIYQLPAAVEAGKRCRFCRCTPCCRFSGPLLVVCPTLPGKAGPTWSRCWRRVSATLRAGNWALADGGDEVVLLDPDWHLADAAACCMLHVCVY
jgi:hypothetical protein